MNKKGLTLIEILVSLVILLLVVASLASVFVSGKMQIAHIRSRLTGTELGKYFLDPFQMYVRQGATSPTANDGWDQAYNQLYIPVGQDSYSRPDPNGLTVGGVTFKPIDYTISRVKDASNNDTGLRRVVVKINWTESPPQ
jgi:prepilin-type N-terminal cleavage/methylation domain-containing protein